MSFFRNHIWYEVEDLHGTEDRCGFRWHVYEATEGQSGIASGTEIASGEERTLILAEVAGQRSASKFRKSEE